MSGMEWKDDQFSEKRREKALQILVFPQQILNQQGASEGNMEAPKGCSFSFFVLLNMRNLILNKIVCFTL